MTDLTEIAHNNEFIKDMTELFKSPDMQKEAIKLAIQASVGCQSATEVVKTIKNVYMLLTRGHSIHL